MVFKLIKSVLKKNVNYQGDLISNKEIIEKNCILQLDDTILIFSQKYKFDLINIKNLKYKDKSLYFTYDQTKYRFTCILDLKDLFNKLHPLTTENEVLFTTKDFIYKIYNTKTSSFVQVDKDLVLEIIKDLGLFYLKLETDDDIIHFEEITTETQYYIDNKNNTFVWSVLKEGSWYTFSISFDSNLTYLEFISKYVSSTYKAEENEEYFKKMEEDNCNYGSNEENEVIFESLEEEGDEYGEGEVVDLNNLEDKNDHLGKNEHLVVGNGRAFVTRESSVGVFENTNEGLEFKENLSGIMKNPAKKIISHDNCKTLIYLDKNDNKILHKIDLDRADVVESWNVNRNINDYFDGSKLVDSETLIGLSDYSVFRIDPRTKEKVTQSKEYKTKNEFMCGMSTSNGHVAVASKNGDLRLYDKIDKRAKSLLPGFGDEVKYVDVTSSGENIICTCKNYLLLYSVDGNYKNQVGKDKPVPKKLTLRPEHLAYINEEINFTPAKFSTDKHEDSIITSTGKFVVKWNLKDVLEGKVYSYQLSRCSDLVVADNFEFGVNDNIIVTMPDDVKSLKGSVLRRPNKKSFE